MPIDEIGTSFLASVLRFIGWILVDVAIEVLIKGLGYLVCKPFRKVDLDSVAALIAGLAAWAIIITVVFIYWGLFSKNIDIDMCLDSGGRYNYETDACEHSW